MSEESIAKLRAEIAECAAAEKVREEADLVGHMAKAILDNPVLLATAKNEIDKLINEPVSRALYNEVLLLKKENMHLPTPEVPVEVVQSIVEKMFRMNAIHRMAAATAFLSSPSLLIRFAESISMLVVHTANCTPERFEYMNPRSPKPNWEGIELFQVWSRLPASEQSF